jgi:hypothetical protein
VFISTKNNGDVGAGVRSGMLTMGHGFIAERCPVCAMQTWDETQLSLNERKKNKIRDSLESALNKNNPLSDCAQVQAQEMGEAKEL